MDYFNKNNFSSIYPPARENMYENKYIYEPTNYSNSNTYYTTQFQKPTYNGLYQNRIEESLNTSNSSLLNEALELIKKSVMDELNDELFYSALLNQAIEQEDKDIIMSIRDDEIKHNKLLRDVYYSLTGTTLPQPRQMTDTEAMTYIENLKKAFMGESEAANKYRKILTAMPDMKNMLIILEILVDELRHADKYNYLITKNKISKLAP